MCRLFAETPLVKFLVFFFVFFYCSCVFLPNNGAFFVNYLITSALIGTALELCRFPELVSYAGNMACARNVGEKRLTRKVRKNSSSWWRVTGYCFWLVEANLQPIRSTSQIWVVTRHQYEVSTLVPRTLFRGETSGDVAKWRLFSQAKK